MSQAALSSARPARRAVPAPSRPPLEVVPRRARRVRRRAIAPVVACALVAASLFLVVIGHSELGAGQVRLANVDTAITAARTAHRQDALAVASLENPARIVNVAENTLHMAPPGQVLQVPHVSLSVPEAAPAVRPAPSTTSSEPTLGPSG